MEITILGITFEIQVKDLQDLKENKEATIELPEANEILSLEMVPAGLGVMSERHGFGLYPWVSPQMATIFTAWS